MSGINFFLYLICIALSGAGAWLVGRYGYRLELLDKPNERSSHRAATPKGGGIGILAGFLFSALLMKVSVFLWVPAVLLSVISFVGDRYHLSPIFRLLFQFAASFIFLLGLWNGHPLSSAGYLIIIPLSVYIVGTTNYFNFMDGINGIAGISGLVGFGLLATRLKFYALAIAAIILVLISFVLTTHQGPSAPSAPPAMAPTNILSKGSLLLAFRNDGLEGLEHYLDASLTQVGPRPTEQLRQGHYDNILKHKGIQNEISM